MFCLATQRPAHFKNKKGELQHEAGHEKRDRAHHAENPQTDTRAAASPLCKPMGMGRRAAGAGAAAHETLTPTDLEAHCMSEAELAELLALWREHPEVHDEIWELLESEEIPESA